MSSLADILKGKGLDFDDELSANTDEYARLMKSIDNGTATFDQVYELGDHTGQIASNHLQKQCEASLENGYVPQEVAENVVLYQKVFVDIQDKMT